MPSPGDAKNDAMACAAHTCVATALVGVVVLRAGDDGYGDVGAARKVESRACDFGGVGTFAVVERVLCRVAVCAHGSTARCPASR